MAKINFLGPIGLESMEIDVSDFEALKAELGKIEALKAWIPLCAVALNDEIISDTSNLKIKKDDTISLLPPVCGG